MRLKILLLAGLILLIVGMVGDYALRDKSTNQAPTVTVPLPKPRPLILGNRGVGDRECLARNLAFETAGNSHSREGIGALMARQEMEAIVRVVFRRVELGKRLGYQNTICGVVNQEGAFSWTYKLPKTAVPTAPGRWQFMLAVADDLLAGKFEHQWPEANWCVENYKRTDNRGVDKKPAQWFKNNTHEVAAYGDHSFFCPKKTLMAAR